MMVWMVVRSWKWVGVVYLGGRLGLADAVPSGPVHIRGQLLGVSHNS